MNDRLDLGQSMVLMDHVEGQVVFGDTKASLLFTADAILLAALGLVVREGSLGAELTVGARSALLVAGATLLVGLLLALWVVLPSGHYAPSTLRWAMPSTDVMFIRWIAAQKDAEAYVDEVLRVDKEALREHALRSIYGKSIVANRKFQALWPAVVTTMLSVAFAALAGVIEVASRV